MMTKFKILKKLVLVCLGAAFCGYAQADQPAKPAQNNEGYCQEIHWKDFDKCVDWEQKKLYVSQNLCETLYWPSTKKRCFEELKKKNGQKKASRKNEISMD